MKNADKPVRQRRVYPLLDAIRGLAALMIVMRHTPELFGVAFPKSYLAVDLFFVLSGLVVANAYEPALRSTLSVARFSWIRIVRLYPLYLASLALAILAWFLDPQSGGVDSYFAVIVALALLMLPAMAPFAPGGDGPPDTASVYPLNPPTWSLFFELGVNLVYARFATRLGPRAIVAVMAGAAVALIAACLITDRHNLDIGWTPRSFSWGTPRVAYSFLAGLLIYRVSGSARLPSTSTRAVAPASGLLLLITFGALSASPPASLSGAWDLVTVLFVFPLVVHLARQLEFGARTRRVFAFMGMASYSIYVLHWPLHTLMMTLARQRQFMLPPAPWSGVAFIAALLVGAHFLDRHFDKPLRKALAGGAPAPAPSQRKA